MILRVSLSFARLPDAELDNFAQGVIAGMTGNAAYASPPVTLVNLQTARNDFTAKIAAAQTGGPPDTAAKNNSRQTLLGLLRQLASYVQINCNNDMATLPGSGFKHRVSTAHRASLSSRKVSPSKTERAGNSWQALTRLRTRACTKAAPKAQ